MSGPLLTSTPSSASSVAVMPRWRRAARGTRRRPRCTRRQPGTVAFFHSSRVNDTSRPGRTGRCSVRAVSEGTCVSPIWRRKPRRGAVGGVSTGQTHAEAIAYLDEFVATRRGVEVFVEPATVVVETIGRARRGRRRVDPSPHRHARRPRRRSPSSTRSRSTTRRYGATRRGCGRGPAPRPPSAVRGLSRAPPRTRRRCPRAARPGCARQRRCRPWACSRLGALVEGRAGDVEVGPR